MSKNLKKIIAASALALSLGLAMAQVQINAPYVPQSAQGSSNTSVGSSLKNIVLTIKDLSTGIYSSLFVIALIAFFFGIIKILVTGTAESRKDGFKFVGFGIFALFVMVGIWGIISFLSSNLGIGLGGGAPIPDAPVNIRAY